MYSWAEYVDILSMWESSPFALQEVDVALLKLYAESNSPELLPLVEANTGCDLKDGMEWLEKFQRHHALAVLCHHHGDNDRALSIWSK